MRAQCDEFEPEVRRLRSIYDEHAGLQDRFLTTGRVTPELADATRPHRTGRGGPVEGRRPALRSARAPPYDRMS